MMRDLTNLTIEPRNQSNIEVSVGKENFNDLNYQLAKAREFNVKIDSYADAVKRQEISRKDALRELYVDPLLQEIYQNPHTDEVKKQVDKVFKIALMWSKAKAPDYSLTKDLRKIR